MSTLRLRLSGDFFQTGKGAAGLDNSVARAILTSLVSEQSEDRGWNAIVREELKATSLVGRVQLLKRSLLQITLARCVTP